MPKLSVIVPVYGVENYIERCARSLFEQTLDDIEYIFVDDCSPDMSINRLESVIGEYQSRLHAENKTVRIERMSKNSGLPAVRRYGVHLATGDYIIHCDSDDWVDVDMYRLMYGKAINDNADAVVCGYYIANEKEYIPYKGACKISRHSIISDILTDRVAGSVWNKMFAKKLYDDSFVYPVGNMAEDVVISIQLLLNSSMISYIPMPLYFYFNNSESLTKSISREIAVRNFVSATNNAKIVLDVINKRDIVVSFKKELDYFKYREKRFLMPYSREKEMMNIWKNTFPEINYRVLLSPYFPLKQKVKYLMFLTRIIA